jgi:hypothetical protein
MASGRQPTLPTGQVIDSKNTLQSFHTRTSDTTRAAVPRHPTAMPTTPNQADPRLPSGEVIDSKNTLQSVRRPLNGNSNIVATHEVQPFDFNAAANNPPTLPSGEVVDSKNTLQSFNGLAAANAALPQMNVTSNQNTTHSENRTEESTLIRFSQSTQTRNIESNAQTGNVHMEDRTDPPHGSKPGAFRAGGVPQRNDDASADRHNSAPSTGLIEAELVEDGTSTAMISPVDKRQMVPQAEAAELLENVVMLPKKHVRCCATVIAALCAITILAIVFVFVQPDNNDASMEESSAREKGPYWYQNQSPEALWATLKGYTYVSHHMAIVSIVNPNITSSSIGNAQGTYGPAMCTPINDSFGTTSNNRRFLNRGSDAAIVVTFTCGGNQASPVTTLVKGRPETMILFHDANVNDALGLDGDFITCKDVKLSNDGPNQYNAVFCQIPSDISGSFPFLFSCFSQTEEMAAVASVETHNLSIQCSATSQGNSSIIIGEPEVHVISPAAVVLSTQRLCRVPDGDGFVLQDSLLDTRNLTDACSIYDMRLDVADVPICLSRSLEVNTSYPLSFCQNDAEFCFAANFTLPNVTVYDPWNGDSEAVEACAFSDSVDDSLVQKNANKTVYPGIPLINSSTLQQMQIYLEAQKSWVQDEVLNTSNT